eukprot:CAMPEP_0177656218 /NCGR_PEP_ID=MMETSP0447-20121125/15428_1 /TAXON_ID=0 /ORGANISM="Stygamoeba regulata, Strain BSH-02190019" /LENGTH=447 /DNA_ID=CAMNT_0019160279 /DNA_START=38 /DNA_END=1381 /DNA_ORIENTATION=+
MSTPALLPLLLACTLFVVCAAGSTLRPKFSDVTELSDETLPKAIASGEKWLVQFYMPSCPHCKKLRPTWLAASTYHPYGRERVHFGSINTSINPATARRLNITGFPSIYYFHEDIEREYSAGRKLKHLKKFVDTVTSEACPRVQCVQQAWWPQLRSLTRPVFALSFHDQVDKSVKAALYKLASKYIIDANFVECTDARAAALAHFHAANSNDRSVLAAVTDNAFQLYDGVWEIEDIEAWVNSAKVMAIPQLSIFQYSFFLKSTTQHAVITGVPADEEGKSPLLQVMREVAAHPNNTKHFSFGWIDSVEHAEYFNNFDVKTLPHFFVIDALNAIHYTDMQIPHTKDAIHEFLHAAINGQVKPLGRGTTYYYKILKVIRDVLMTHPILSAVGFFGTCFALLFGGIYWTHPGSNSEHEHGEGEGEGEGEDDKAKCGQCGGVVQTESKKDK